MIKHFKLLVTMVLIKPLFFTYLMHLLFNVWLFMIIIEIMSFWKAILAMVLWQVFLKEIVQFKYLMGFNKGRDLIMKIN